MIAPLRFVPAYGPASIDARKGLASSVRAINPVGSSPCPPHDFGTAFPRAAPHHAGNLRVSEPFLERPTSSLGGLPLPTSVRHGGWLLCRLYQSLIFHASPDP